MDPPKIATTKTTTSELSQPTSSSPFSSLVNIIEKYKTSRCMNADCKYNREKMFETDGLLLYDCFDFHSKTDQRRPVVVKPVKNKVATGTLLYSKNVALEILLSQKPNENSEKHCLNGYEYLYHPLNYRTLECYINKTTKCTSVYCPYYHTVEEKAYFEEYRKIVDQNTNKIPLVEEIQNNVNKINDLVKKAHENDGFSASGNSHHIKLKNKQSGEYYIYDDAVKFIEDHYHEFKCLKLHLDTVIKYICGFLNSKGGTLYFGINNDGIVKGTDVKEYEIQSFKKKLYDSLKKFVPPVDEEEVNVNFVPVYKMNNKTQTAAVMPNSFVIEILIKKPSWNDLFFTNYKECFVKRSASINQLKTKEIKEYVKTFIQKKNAESLHALELKVEKYRGINLEQLSPKELQELEKTLQNTLSKVENKLAHH